MAVRDDRGDVIQTTTEFRVPLKVQSLTSAKANSYPWVEAHWWIRAPHLPKANSYPLSLKCLGELFFFDMRLQSVGLKPLSHSVCVSCR